MSIKKMQSKILILNYLSINLFIILILFLFSLSGCTYNKYPQAIKEDSVSIITKSQKDDAQLSDKNIQEINGDINEEIYENKYIIAVMAPFTGHKAQFGKNIFDAISLYVGYEGHRDDKNTKDDKSQFNSIYLLRIDTGTSAEELESAIKKIKQYKRIDAIIGPVFSNQINTVYTEYAKKHHVPLFGLSNDSSLVYKINTNNANSIDNVNNVDNANYIDNGNSKHDSKHTLNNNLYVMGVFLDDQLQQLINDWYKKTTASCIGDMCGEMYSIIPNNTYGNLFANVLERNSMKFKNGGTIFRYSTNEVQSIQDIGNIVRKIKMQITDSGLCANDGIGKDNEINIFVTEGNWKLSKIYSQIYESQDMKNCNIRFIGLNNWNEQNKNNIKRAAFINSGNDYMKDFMNDFKEKYNYEPSKLAYVAYDSSVAILTSIKMITNHEVRFRSGSGVKSNNKWMLDSNVLQRSFGFVGANGVFVINADGNSCYIADIVWLEG